MSDQVEHRRMGFQKCPTSFVFLREFRWTCEPDGFDNACFFIKTVEYDLFAKTLKIEAMDVAGEPVLDWLTHDPRANLTLKFFDACGVMVEKIEFVEVEPKDHKVRLDYSSSDVVTHRAAFTYKYVRRHSLKMPREDVTATPLDSGVPDPATGTGSSPEDSPKQAPYRPVRTRKSAPSRSRAAKV